MCSLQSLYNFCVTKINIKPKLHVYKHCLTKTFKAIKHLEYHIIW
jgi:hypothetical protein